jgi:hypothetical protein
MVRFGRIFTFLSLAISAAALAQAPPTIPITGNLNQILGTPTPYAGMKIQLQNCPSPSSVAGYNVIVQTAVLLQSNAQGQINSNIIPNDVITCNGTTGQSMYAVTYIVAGAPSGTQQCYQVASTQTLWNINTQQPITCSQPPPNPQDAQYRNLNITGCLSIDGGPCIPSMGGGPGSVNPGITFVNQTLVTMNYGTYGFTLPNFVSACYDQYGNEISYVGSVITVASSQYSYSFGFAQPQSGTCVVNSVSSGNGGLGLYLPLAGGNMTGPIASNLSHAFNPTTPYLGNVFTENGYLASDVLSGAGITYDIAFGVGQTIPTGSTLTQGTAIGAFTRCQGYQTYCVGFYGQGNAATNNANIWGINTNLGDGDVYSANVINPGHTYSNVTLFNELDCNSSQPTTNAACLFINGNISLHGSSFGQIHLGKNVGTGKWSYGILFDDGEVNGYAIQIGSFDTTANSGSQYIALNWRDGSNVVHTASIDEGPADQTLHLLDSADGNQNFSVDQGNVIVGNNATIPPFGTGLPTGSVLLANGGELASSANPNTALIPLIGATSANLVQVDANSQGVLFGQNFSIGACPLTNGFCMFWNATHSVGEIDFANAKGSGAGGMYFYPAATNGAALGTLGAIIGPTGRVTATECTQIGGANGPTFCSGNTNVGGLACSVNGSTYSNTSGGTGSTFFTCVSNLWVDIK